MGVEGRDRGMMGHLLCGPVHGCLVGNTLWWYEAAREGLAQDRVEGLLYATWSFVVRRHVPADDVDNALLGAHTLADPDEVLRMDDRIAKFLQKGSGL